MTVKTRLPLSKMKNSQSGTVIAINGGRAICSKLGALGIQPGVKIVKKSRLIGSGPVVVSVGNTDIAIGYGMATRILVELD